MLWPETDLNWLMSKKGRILVQKKPVFIEAVQGKLERFYLKYNPLKKIFIIISSDSSNIIVDLKIQLRGWISLNEMNSYWYELVEDLWEQIGVRLEKDDLRRFYPKKMLRTEFIFGILAGSFFSLIGGYFFYIAFKNIHLLWSTPIKIQVFLSIILGICTFIVFAYRPFKLIYNSVKRNQELYK